jgi:hypothetical protein
MDARRLMRKETKSQQTMRMESALTFQHMLKPENWPQFPPRRINKRLPSHDCP